MSFMSCCIFLTNIVPAPAVSSDASELLDPPEGVRAGLTAAVIENSSPPPLLPLPVPPPPDDPDRRPLLLPLFCDCCCSAPVCSTLLQLFGTLMTQRLW
uniref:Putative secreted protein n=1 Tax=Anopheles triannulatus TaxID=58253 RepID=A0A2M4B3I8_9DIPT